MAEAIVLKDATFKMYLLQIPLTACVLWYAKVKAGQYYQYVAGVEAAAAKKA